MTSGLQSAVEALYGLERRRSDFRVEDTARLLAAIGDPHCRYRAIHVAGTNGKGSVCAFVERVLRATGVRTGLTTSPHLVDYRERIRVAGRMLEATDLEQRLDVIRSLEAAAGRTYFEITTVLAFDAFARHGVEWAVVEVGLGGRLDATNVLEPDVTAVTSVALDHTEILGNTLAEVAREKAGIIKPGVPVITGLLVPEAAAQVRAAAESRGAPLAGAHERVVLRGVRTHVGGAEFTAECEPWGALHLEIGLRGGHQVGNARVALALLSSLAMRGVAIPEVAIRQGFAAARWPGRLEPCPAEPRLWWDGAHNPDGLERLVESWRRDLELPPPDAIVFAVSRDKPAAAMLEALRRWAPAATLYVARTRNDRAASPAALVDAARRAGWDAADARAFEDVGEAIVDALQGCRGRVLLAGSLFAVGEAMTRFGGAPGEQV